MNKKEFLEELENALSGRMPESDVREVISDYGDVFNQGATDGKTDDEISKEIGSPAKIARTILEGTTAFDRDQNNNGYSGGERQYTDFQKNINEKTSKIFDKVIEPDQTVRLEQLASMPRRLGAYVLDGLLIGVLGIGLLMVLLAPVFFTRFTGANIIEVPFHHMGGMGEMMFKTTAFAPRFFSMNIVTLVLMLGVFNIFTTIILWATNGYTPGKWMLGIRVIKLNGNKISFLDALLRELAIKCIVNSMLSGFLNVISFIWGCVTDDHKTVHDLAAQTRVVEWNRLKRSANANESKPFES